MENQRANELNPLVWAFVGDAVFTLKVRSHLAHLCDNKNGALHKKCSNLINAGAQSLMLEQLLPFLDESELNIVRRARNTKTNNKAKNADTAQYHKATALEALLGYLYLTNRLDRLEYIQNFCLKVLTNES